MWNWHQVIMTNSCYFFRKIRDMRPNNDARVDLKRRMIVLSYFIPIFKIVYSLCTIDTGNCVPGKRENNDGSHTRGSNFIIYSCLYLYYVVKEYSEYTILKIGIK
jgi:hypothetical protein